MFFGRPLAAQKNLSTMEDNLSCSNDSLVDIISLTLMNQNYFETEFVLYMFVIVKIYSYTDIGHDILE